MTRLTTALEHKPDTDSYDLPPAHLPWQYCQLPECGKPIPWRRYTPTQYVKKKGCCREHSKIIAAINQRAAIAKKENTAYIPVTERTKADIECEFNHSSEPKPGKVPKIDPERYESYMQKLENLYTDKVTQQRVRAFIAQNPSRVVVGA